MEDRPSACTVLIWSSIELCIDWLKNWTNLQSRRAVLIYLSGPLQHCLFRETETVWGRSRYTKGLISRISSGECCTSIFQNFMKSISREVYPNFRILLIAEFSSDLIFSWIIRNTKSQAPSTLWRRDLKTTFSLWLTHQMFSVHTASGEFAKDFGQADHMMFIVRKAAFSIFFCLL